jgi:hypothetical protein
MLIVKVTEGKRGWISTNYNDPKSIGLYTEYLRSCCKVKSLHYKPLMEEKMFFCVLFKKSLIYE